MTRHARINERLREAQPHHSPTRWFERAGATPQDCPACSGAGLVDGCTECGEVAEATWTSPPLPEPQPSALDDARAIQRGLLLAFASVDADRELTPELRGVAREGLRLALRNAITYIDTWEADNALPEVNF